MGQKNVELVRNRRGPKVPTLPTPKEDLEGAVLGECLDLLSAMGIVCWRSNTGAVKIDTRYIKFGPKGKADIIGLLPNGRFLAVECKRRHGGKQSDDQRAFEQAIVGSKGVYLLVHSAGELVDQLKGVML